MTEDRDSQFERLFAYYPGVLAFLRRLGFAPDEAKDLAQDVFVRVFEYMDVYRGEAEWTWVQRIARTVALNEIRSRHTQKREAILESEDSLAGVADDDAPNPEEWLTQQAGVDRIKAAIDQLPPGQRQPLLLYLAGFKYHEIEQVMGISDSALKSRLHEARKRLKELLDG